MKRIITGILAHVDAGKTTLSESLLYIGGTLKNAGRVDHGNAFLDNFQLERERGITIFSKQARVSYKGLDMVLLDTPGHVDFSSEMERTLQVLDYAILVISGTDGIQAHTETLWKLLEIYSIPTFIFINKMDIAAVDKDAILNDIRKRFGDGCVDFNDTDTVYENVAVCDDKLIEKYLESSVVEKEDIVKLILDRKVFPCFFGAALKMDGVEELLNGLNEYAAQKRYGADFGARVYKVARDEQGTRLTYLKVTGGALRVKTELKYSKEGESFSEKVNQIRLYSGEKYNAVEEIPAGTVCAVTGLSHTYAGQGFGAESGNSMVLMQPVLNYSIESDGINDMHGLYLKLKQLEEEEPQLHIKWNEKLQEINVQLMGEVQVEVLKRLISDKFGISVEFGMGSIVYRETIENEVEGVGHFEPLRHYAEVHLLLEPLERGRGLVFSSDCSEDVLDKNWQRLVLTHLNEREHIGVLTGSPITDMKITLVAGKAHLKHTEGGDFRQATYRAVRQGLKSAKSILLEPFYKFTLEIPQENVGRAMTDMQKMHGTFNQPDITADKAVIKGRVPVSSVQGYITEVNAYTKGKGRFSLQFDGFDRCHNQDEVIESIGYDSEKDLDNPTGSVFCSHGSGYNVPWNEVREHMHLPGLVIKEGNVSEEDAGAVKSDSISYHPVDDDKELQEIFERTFGPVKRKLNSSFNRLGYEKSKNTE